MGRGTDYPPLGYFLAQREGEEARRGLIGPRPKVEVRVERELERKQRELASLEQEEASLKATFQALTRSPARNPTNSTLQQVSWATVTNP